MFYTLCRFFLGTEEERGERGVELSFLLMLMSHFPPPVYPRPDTIHRWKRTAVLVVVVVASRARAERKRAHHLAAKSDNKKKGWRLVDEKEKVVFLSKKNAPPTLLLLLQDARLPRLCTCT